MTTLKNKLKRAKDSIASTASDVGGMASKAAQTAKESISSTAADVASKASIVAHTTMTALTDLNGDGKVDAEDLKIALEKAKAIGSEVAEQTGKLAKGATDHPMVKDAAAGALVGGAIGAVLPVVGTAVGATIGAAFSVVSGRNRNVVHVTTVDAPIPKKRAPRKAGPSPSNKTSQAKPKPSANNPATKTKAAASKKATAKS